MAKYFCCPNCGNRDLQSTTETVTTTTGKNYSAGQGCLGWLLFGPLGLLCGLCGQGKHTNTTNTTYWVCNKCGKKFRSPDDIRNNASNGNAVLTAMLVVGACLGLLCFIFFAVSGALYDDGLVVIPVLSLGIFGLFALIGFILKKSVDREYYKADREARLLENAMAKFRNSNNSSDDYHKKSSDEVSSRENEKGASKCPKCNLPVPENAAFCNHCGARIDRSLNAKKTIQQQNVRTNEKLLEYKSDSSAEDFDEGGFVECVFCGELTYKDQKNCIHCGRRQD